MLNDHIMRKFTFLCFLTLLVAACDGKSGQKEFIPEAPDYGDAVSWYVREDDATGRGADVLYFVSTWEADWTADDGSVCHYADVWNPGHRADMDTEISRIADYMGEGNNFYSPYYRQITIDVWETQDEEVVADRFRLSNEDIQEAFRVFMERRDPDRPFVLAGFSQGAKAVVEVPKNMPDSLHRHLVAAYVLGYKVTPEDVQATDNIRAAQGATDLGVTVCYNSVSDVEYIKPIISVPCAMCINPVNWRTDDTPAILHDTITVTLSPAHHVLVLDGYSGDEYEPIRGFLNVGDFHGCEPWLYQDCLRRNIKDRIEAYYDGL